MRGSREERDVAEPVARLEGRRERPRDRRDVEPGLAVDEDDHARVRDSTAAPEGLARAEPSGLEERRDAADLVLAQPLEERERREDRLESLHAPHHTAFSRRRGDGRTTPGQRARRNALADARQPTMMFAVTAIGAPA